jgi:hypothetical protein
MVEAPPPPAFALTAGAAGAEGAEDDADGLELLEESGLLPPPHPVIRTERKPQPHKAEIEASFDGFMVPRFLVSETGKRNHPSTSSFPEKTTFHSLPSRAEGFQCNLLYRRWTSVESQRRTEVPRQSAADHSS